MAYTTLVLIVVSLISFSCFCVFSIKRNYSQDQHQIFKLYVWHFVVKRLEWALFLRLLHRFFNKFSKTVWRIRKCDQCFFSTRRWNSTSVKTWKIYWWKNFARSVEMSLTNYILAITDLGQMGNSSNYMALSLVKVSISIWFSMHD